MIPFLIVNKEYWDRIRNGAEGNFYLNRLAGQLARENGINLPSYTVVEVREAGYFPESVVEGRLHQVQDLQGVRQNCEDVALRERSPNITPETQDSENNIYKTIVDSNSKTGRGRSRWRYMERMMEILEGDPLVTPPVTVSFLSGLRDQRISGNTHIKPNIYISQFTVPHHVLNKQLSVHHLALLQHQRLFQSHQDRVEQQLHKHPIHGSVQFQLSKYGKASEMNHAMNHLHGSRNL